MNHHQINYNCFNEPFAVSPYRNLYWDMHGLIFETSIWLLAGSTRLVATTTCNAHCIFTVSTDRIGKNVISSYINDHSIVHRSSCVRIERTQGNKWVGCDIAHIWWDSQQVPTGSACISNAVQEPSFNDKLSVPQFIILCVTLHWLSVPMTRYVLDPDSAALHQAKEPCHGHITQALNQQLQY